MTERPILLDTCALLWLASGDPIRSAAYEALARAERDGVAVWASPISAWEVGQLVSRGRLALGSAPDIWFRRMIDGGISLAPLTPDILVASSFLPGPALRDPADKIVAATARAFGYRLMTRDRPLLALAEEGHLQGIAC